MDSKPHECRFREVLCHICHKKGHIARVCRNKGRQRGNRDRQSTERAHHIQEDKPETDEQEDTYTLLNVTSGRAKPIRVTVSLNGVKIIVEVDTGAAVSILSALTYNQLCEANGKLNLMRSNIKLKSYTDHQIEVLGSCSVTVKYEDHERKLSVLVVKGQGPCLLGRNWMSELKLNWKVIGQVDAREDSQVVIDKYSEVFEGGLGTLRGVTAKIHLDPQVTPRFYRPCPVPYAWRQKVEAVLDRLEREGIVERIQFSEWAAPVVPVLKQDGSIRLCRDYKLTVNLVAKLDICYKV